MYIIRLLFLIAKSMLICNCHEAQCIMVLISSTKHLNKINSMLSLSSKALYCTSSKCTNRKTTPRMVSTRLDFDKKISFKMNPIATAHSRRQEKVLKTCTLVLFINGALRFVREVQEYGDSYTFFLFVLQKSVYHFLIIFEVLCFTLLLFFTSFLRTSFVTFLVDFDFEMWFDFLFPQFSLRHFWVERKVLVLSVGVQTVKLPLCV